MAAGNYQVDLTVIDLAEVNTSWVDINQAGGGGANEAAIDFAIQGTNAISRQVNNTRRGVLYNNGAGIALGTDDHVYVWTVSATPGITDLKSAGGIRISIGDTTNDYYDFYVNGSDTLPQGGMTNYAVYYTGSFASLQNGTPTGNPQYFGSQIVTVATARGLNFACDAIRYGTGYYIFDGDVTTPITFDSASQDNDLNANRFGVLTAVPGGFALKGRFVIGQTTASVATQAYFQDSNTAVTFTDTEYSLPDFTQINFDHQSTVANLTNISFTAIGTNNPGQLNVLNASTTASFNSLVFNNTGQTKLNANTSVTGSTWNTCGVIYQSGSGITTSTFNSTSSPSASIISNDPSLINNSNFVGDGTKFGIEIDTAGTYNFISNTFTGYVSGSDPGAELLFNPTTGTGDLTLNVLGGGSNLNFINRSTGTVTINNNIQVTLTGMKDFTEVRVLDVTTPSNPIELAGIENVVSASVGANDNDFSFSQPAGTFVDIVVHALNFEYQRISNFEVPTAATEIPIQQRADRNYSNP